MFCSAEGAGLVYRSLPTGELGVVPRTGHEMSRAVVDTMVDFLIRHSPST